MKKLKYFYAAIFAILICLNTCTNKVLALSLDVANADIREILTMTASAGNINIMLDDSVEGNVSLKLTGLEPKDLLCVISESNGYTWRWQNNIMYIFKGDKKQNLHSVKVRYVDLNKAAQMIELLLAKGNISVEKNDKAKNNKTSSNTNKSTNTNIDINDKHVVIDSDDNNLIFYASDEEYLKVKHFLQEIDKAPRQVSLEAKVTAVQKDAEKNLGISWEWPKLPQTPSHDISYDTVSYEIENSDGSTSKVTNYVPVDEVTRNWQGSNMVPGVIRFGKGPEGFPYEFYYAAQLNALISDGKANILARPNITTIQGNEAVINIGSEVPVPTISTTDSTTTTSLEYREAGIILKCTPRVNEDGIITVKVHTEVSSPLYVEDMKAYRFQKRSADTIVRLRDGETMVIGGLIGSDEAKQMSKIPFLGDIPVLGNLFKHVQKSKSDTEVMIFLTAREVR